MKTDLFRYPQRAALLMLVTLSTALFAQNPPSVQEQLAAQYPLAAATNGCNVGNPETALVTQGPGAGMRILPVNSTVTIAKCTNRFANGKLSFPSSACNGEAISKAQSMASKIPGWGGRFGKGQSHVDDQVANQQMDVVKTGDTIYPVKLEVNDSKGEVKFDIITCKQSGDQQNAYKGEIVFQFAKDMVKAENVTKIEDTIAQVFQPGGNQQAQDGDQQAGGQDAQQANNQGSACNPEIGQTVDQVTAACGSPASQAKGAGTKLLYFYNQPKIKIIFLNGKVSDIE